MYNQEIITNPFGKREFINPEKVIAGKSKGSEKIELIPASEFTEDRIFKTDIVIPLTVCGKRYYKLVSGTKARAFIAEGR